MSQQGCVSIYRVLRSVASVSEEKRGFVSAKNQSLEEC